MDGWVDGQADGQIATCLATEWRQALDVEGDKERLGEVGRETGTRESGKIKMELERRQQGLTVRGLSRTHSRGVPRVLTEAAPSVGAEDQLRGQR